MRTYTHLFSLISSVWIHRKKKVIQQCNTRKQNDMRVCNYDERKLYRVYKWWSEEDFNVDQYSDVVRFSHHQSIKYIKLYITVNSSIKWYDQLFNHAYLQKQFYIDILFSSILFSGIQSFLLLLNEAYLYNNCYKRPTKMKRGKLKFKDGKQAKPFTSKKQQQPQIESIFQQRFKVKDKITTFDPRTGSGLILTSGKGVNGEQTKFNTEIQKGDTIGIQHPVSKLNEQRNVMLVLGDNSLMLEQPFTQDIISLTHYTIKKKSKVELGQDLTQAYKQKRQKLQQSLKTKPISKQVMNVRVKKGPWSYEIKKVEIEEGMSKEEQLNIRQKMGKDKFCW